MLNLRFKNLIKRKCYKQVTKTEKRMSDFTSIPHLIAVRLQGEGDYNVRIVRTEIEEQCNTNGQTFHTNKTGHRSAQNNNMSVVYVGHSLYFLNNYELRT